MSGSYNVQPSERTEIIRGSENVIDVVLKFASNTKTKIDACLDYSRPSLAFDIESISKSLADIKAKKGIRLRVITEITAENISSCKQLGILVDELRHLDGIKGSFYISEGEYLAPAIFHEEGKGASQMIYSNVRELVEHQQYVFDTLWNKSIPSDEKIKEIEVGIQPQFIETVRHAYQIQERAVRLLTSAREEWLILYSTANAFHRIVKRYADLGREMATKYRVKIRILTPFDDSIKQSVEELGKYVEFRYIPEELQTHLTIGLVDRKFSFVVETNDDSKDSSYEAMGLATFSNSASTVSSYVSIFETLWKQSGMYEESQNQLHSAEAELDRMKQYLNEVLEEVASFKKPVER
jgi:two-component system, OmpR family, sensor histidine kinase VicK